MDTTAESPVRYANHASKLEESNGVNAQQLENPGHQTKKAKLVRHLKRYWWVHAIIIILVAALAILLTIFVGVKNIAQSKINDATLDVLGISCTGTHTNTFTLGINTTLKSGTTKATVEAFQGVMYLEDEPSHTPFVTINFPETQNQPFQTVNISQPVNITDIPALTTFNTWLLTNESLRVTVLGYPNVVVPGISRKYGVTFKKTLTMPGLNGFAGMSVFNSSISISNFTDGTNFHSTVTIPNKSLVTFEIVSQIRSPSCSCAVPRSLWLTPHPPGQRHIHHLHERHQRRQNVHRRCHPAPRQQHVQPPCQH